MVVNNVHDYADARAVQSLNHLLALVDSNAAVVGICRITSLGDIVVNGIVAPVILFHNVLALINRAEVVHWHDLNVFYAEFFKIVNTGRSTALNTVNGCIFLGKCGKLSAVFLRNAACLRR